MAFSIFSNCATHLLDQKCPNLYHSPKGWCVQPGTSLSLLLSSLHPWICVLPRCVALPALDMTHNTQPSQIIWSLFSWASCNWHHVCKWLICCSTYYYFVPFFFCCSIFYTLADTPHWFTHLSVHVHLIWLCSYYEIAALWIFMSKVLCEYLFSVLLELLDHVAIFRLTFGGTSIQSSKDTAAWLRFTFSLIPDIVWEHNTPEWKKSGFSQWPQLIFS